MPRDRTAHSQCNSRVKFDPETGEKFNTFETPKALPRELQLRRNFEIYTLWEREKEKPKEERKWNERTLGERYGLGKQMVHQIIYQTRRHVDWQGNIPHANLFADKVNENDPPIISRKIRYLKRDRKSWLKWIPRWLGVYAQTGNKLKACKAAHVGWMTVMDYAKKNQQFARKMDDAYEQSIELKEGEVDRRGFNGFTVKTHYYKGKPVGKEIGYSDLLAMFRLKKLKPEYRDNHNQKIQVDVNVKNDIDGARRILADPVARKQALDLARKLALEPPTELVEPGALSEPSEEIDDDDQDGELDDESQMTEQDDSQPSQGNDDQVGNDSGT